jgi:hypothetical protein
MVSPKDFLLAHAVPRRIPRTTPFDYEGAFCRSSQRALEHLERIVCERGMAEAHLLEVLTLPRSRREQALRVESRFHSYSFASYVLDRSEGEVSSDPAKAWELARVARSVISRIEPNACGGTEALKDLEAYSLAVEGNILRVHGDFPAARKAFSAARSTQKSGGTDPDLAATIDHMESSLRRDLWQFDAALALLDRAAEGFAALGKHHRLVQVVLNRANIHIVRDNWFEAAAILRGVMDWIPDPRLALAARHNFADVLVKAGRADEAAQVVAASADLYERWSDTLTANRRIWVEGLITRELGEDMQLASELLEHATENFKTMGYACDAGLAQLDLIATRRKLALSRRRRSAREGLADPLHAGVAAAQQDAHPPAAEPFAVRAGEDTGQGGGSGRLDHDLEIARDQS